MGRCMSPKGSRTVLSGGKGGDYFKTLPIAIDTVQLRKRTGQFCESAALDVGRFSAD